MKKMLFATTLLASVLRMAIAETVSHVSEITEDFLVKLGKESGYLDYIPHLQEIFKHKKFKTMLEFGTGYQTKYFLDTCRKVISVDFFTPSHGPYDEDGMGNCLKLYQDYSNWIPLAYFSGYTWDVNWASFKYLGSEHVNRANEYRNKTRHDYSKIDRFYMIELDAFIGNILRYHKVDFALVNPRMYLRGDLVSLLMSKIPVIMAHDMGQIKPNENDDLYGYSKVNVPSDYEEIFIFKGSGTTVWIIKNEEHKGLIAELKKYATQL